VNDVAWTTSRPSNADPELSALVGRGRARPRSLVYSPGVDALKRGSRCPCAGAPPQGI
jgi:hypothetical protein